MNQADWQSLLNEGIQAIGRQNADLARQKLESAYRLAPHERDVRYWLGNALRINGDAKAAEKAFRLLMEEFPADEDTAFALAFLLREEGRPEHAARVLLDLVESADAGLEPLMRITGFLRDSNQFEAAAAVCLKAVQLEPGRADLHFKLARLFQATGAFEAALGSLRRTLEIDATIGGAWLSLSQLRRFENGEEGDFKQLLRTSRQVLGDEADMCVAFAMGKALDDLGRWPEAWGQFHKGNRLRHAAQPWKRESWRAFVTKSLNQPAPSGADVSSDVRRPVFIVGMLRSGTTLLEQRLDRHPRITGRGELNFLARVAGSWPGAAGMPAQARQELAQELWTHMRLQGPESGIYIDKNPLNFRFLPQLFRIFPQARVIHLIRDGRDSCLSCYFQLFQHTDSAFSNDLHDLVDYYRGYRRLMRHWQPAFGNRVHTVSYQDLVNATAATLTGILDFLAVGRDPSVLETGDQDRAVRTASTWQARQPIYRRSLGRWRNYYEQAPEFFDEIQSIDREHGPGQL
jgi:tetratricopeptide (TPR) repeat protein